MKVLRVFMPSPWVTKQIGNIFLFGMLSILVIFLVAWNYFLAYGGFESLQSRDFSRFFYATMNFLQGHDMYGPTVATLCRWTDLLAEHLWDLNPPHFHIFVLPFVYFSLPEAYIIWEGINILALLVSLRLIGKIIQLKLTPLQGVLAIIGLLAFAGTGSVLRTGQFVFLLILPLNFAWYYARAGEWAKAGMILGLLASMKPFLLIFFPYLVFRKLTRAAGNFILVFLLAFALGLLIFGPEAHFSWVKALSSVSWGWPGANASLLGLFTRLFVENPHFMNFYNWDSWVGPIWVVSIVVVALSTLIATSIDTSANRIDRAFAILPLSAVLISPLGWVLYLFFSLGPLISLTISWWNKVSFTNTFRENLIQRIRNILLIAGIPGLFLPTIFLNWLQPHPLATLFIGSLYFWCTFVIWLSLILDYSVRVNWARCFMGPIFRFRENSFTSLKQS